MSSSLRRAVALARADKAKKPVGAKTMTAEEKAQVKQVFQLFDADNSGAIDATELRAVMLALGWKVSKEDVKRMISSIDLDGGGTVDFEEFLGILDMASASADPQMEALKTFNMFTNDKDQSSTAITKQHLARIAQDSQLTMTDAELQAMLDAAGGTDGVTLPKFMNVLLRTGQM